MAPDMTAVQERRLRRSLAVACAVAAGILTIDHGNAQNSAFCANTRSGSSICAFSSFEQCRAYIAGIGGNCAANPWHESKSRAAPEEKGATVKRPPPKERPSAKREARPGGVTRERSAAPSRGAPNEIATPPAAARAVPSVPAPVATTPDPQSLRGLGPSQLPAPLQAASPFEAARKLVLEGQYDAGITALWALGYDDHSDIAAYIGLANLKLKRTDEAKSWFERALSADPNNLVALASYGALLAGQGRLVQAMSNLEKIKLLCGVGCAEYGDLDRAIAGRLR